MKTKYKYTRKENYDSLDLIIAYIPSYSKEELKNDLMLLRNDILAKQDQPIKENTKEIELIKNQVDGYFIDVNNQIITTKINEIIEKINSLNKK